MRQLFDLNANGSDLRTELIAGATTFLTMAYIMFVNPAILGETGMPREAVFVATCLAAALGSLIMGLYANYPIGMAPGMGLNAFFAFTVVAALGFTWQQALGAVFISGTIFVILTVTGVRSWLIAGIPHSLRSAIAAGIGVALQPDIQDIVSGLFINFEGSYAIGDWVTIDADDLKAPIYGCISNQSWRASFLVLEDGTRASVPNNYFTSKVAINHSHPVGAKKLSVQIAVDNRLPAGRVIDMFLGEAFKAVATRHTAQKIDALAPSGLTSGEAYQLELHTRGAHGAASRELETYIWPGTLAAA